MAPRSATPSRSARLRCSTHTESRTVKDRVSATNSGNATPLKSLRLSPAHVLQPWRVRHDACRSYSTERRLQRRPPSSAPNTTIPHHLEASVRPSFTKEVSGPQPEEDPSAAFSSRMMFVFTQVAFLATAYIHAWWCGELNYDKPHMSGVLDDERRSITCALIVFSSLHYLLRIEAGRTIPFEKERLFLAKVICCGIVGVCLFRESRQVILHGFFAVTVFTAGWCLVMIVTLCHPGSWKAVTTLSVLTLVTGLAQGMTVAHNLGHDYLPCFGNTILAAGEWGMVLVFDLCVICVGQRRRI